MTRHLHAVREPLAPSDAERIALARSLLGHAEGHEQRAVREALAALDGADIDQLRHDREEED